MHLRASIKVFSSLINPPKPQRVNLDSLVGWLSYIPSHIHQKPTANYKPLSLLKFCYNALIFYARASLEAHA